jgi:hypothetical protein
METSTTKGIATSLHPYTRSHTKKLVHKKLELHRGTVNWIDLQQNFVITFAFEHENLVMDATLKLIK